MSKFVHHYDEFRLKPGDLVRATDVTDMWETEIVDRSTKEQGRVRARETCLFIQRGTDDRLVKRGLFLFRGKLGWAPCYRFEHA